MMSPVLRAVVLTMLFAVPIAVRAGEARAFRADFARVHDRIWVGPELWANPMEDWRVQDGRLECTSGGGNRSVHALTRQLGKQAGGFSMSVWLGLLGKGDSPGSAGFRVGIQDEIDDYRARLIYGTGLDAGIRANGSLFIGQAGPPGVAKLVKPVPLAGKIKLTLSAALDNEDYTLTLKAFDEQGAELQMLSVSRVPAAQLYGNVALVNNHAGMGKPAKGMGAEGKGPRFWFNDWRIDGPKVVANDKQAFGPVLWAMHTLSRGTLKMNVQMPPVGAQEPQTVRLQVQQRPGHYKLIAGATIDPQARTATFRVPNWDADQDVPYRVAYTMTDRDGKETEHFYTGTVRKDPTHKDTLVLAAFTGNADYGFPNREIVSNLEHQNPDVLFFSGDNIYEYVGGFPLIRTPPDRAILNYLRKWYLVGLAFGDLCRDRPSIFIPDDHDVYQGNIWGNGGNPITLAEHERGGYVQHPDFVNVVHKTQCGSLPDPVDPAPIQQNISVYFTDLVYGRVGFAVIADRMFKSGPKGNVPPWPGRPDHLKDPKLDVATLDKPGLKLLGERQEKFLRDWAADWRGVDLKCVLSQTIFCNLANYHGPKREYLVADLDSGGWPQSARNRALDLMRRGFALHVAGDQHLASIVHHGMSTPGDANWSFCVPSIANFYPRSWQPDKEGLPVKNRPKNGLPNTGDYLDGFKNHIRVWAIGNPEDDYRKGRLAGLHDKASGYGVVRFNTAKQTMTMECYRLLVNVAKPGKADQFPGWPKTIHLLENYGRQPAGHLPTLEVKGMQDPVVQVIEEKTKDIVYTLRIKGTRFRPMVFADGKYAVRVGEPGTKLMQTVGALAPTNDEKKSITVNLGQ